MQRTRLALVAAAAVVTGFAIWAAAPMVLGRVEPWDAGIEFYLVVMGVVGFLLGFAAPRPLGIAAAFAGIWIGQIAFIALLRPHSDPPWFPLGVIVTGIGSVPVLIGSVIGAAVGMGRQRQKTRRQGVDDQPTGRPS